jgi:glutathione S-transferase
MADLILHHYAGSLFSEKIRLLLGYLGLPWKSVEIAPIMPRPELMPLTGGYRRTPVMQEGADIYCDTRVIAERLAELAGHPQICRGFVPNRVAEWADSRLFQIVVSITFQPRAVAASMSRLSATELAAFQKDRAELAKGATGSPPAVIAPFSPPSAEAHFKSYLDELEQSIASPFLFGNAPVIADFSIYHCLWLVLNNPIVAPLVGGRERVTDWRTRMAAFGHGRFEAMSRADALAVGRAATPRPAAADASGLPPGLHLGDTAAVTPTDYGMFPVKGRLVSCGTRSVAIERNDPEAGTVVVHFPRIGFVVDKA